MLRAQPRVEARLKRNQGLWEKAYPKTRQISYLYGNIRGEDEEPDVDFFSEPYDEFDLWILADHC